MANNTIKWDKTQIKTEKQWLKEGLVPKPYAKPVYVWTDRNGKAKSVYWHISDMVPIDKSEDK